MLTFFSILNKVNIMKNMHHLKYACRFDLLGNSFCCVVSYLCSGNFWGFPWKTPRKGSSFWEVATQHFIEFFKHFQSNFSVEHLWGHLCAHHYFQYASIHVFLWPLFFHILYTPKYGSENTGILAYLTQFVFASLRKRSPAGETVFIY